jgi:hypothetical protein
MKIINNIYDLIKKRWVLVCLSIIVLITLFFPTNTKKVGEDYNNYIKYEEENKKVGEETQAPFQPPVLTAQEKQELNKGEVSYAQGQQKLFEKYPWYGEIPITKADYLVDYDFEKESFRIALLISETSTEAEKNNVINRALQDIRDIGANPTKYFTIFIQNTN